MRCQVLEARRVKRAGILGASQRARRAETGGGGGRGECPGGGPFIRPGFLCMCGPIVKGKKGKKGRERREKGGERRGARG